MAQDFQTSFIPTGKQTSAPSSMIPGGSTTPKKDILGTILFLLTLVIFIATALYTGYSVWYEKKLETEIGQLQQELELIRKSVVDGEIDAVEKMNNRLEHSNQLLSRHIAPILLFDMLEEDTLPTITFKNFLFEAQDQKYQITAAGQAANFQSIVFQSDVYGENPAFRDVLFSNLQRTPQGNVTFSFSTFVTKDSVRYLSQDFSVLDQGVEAVEESENAALISNEEGSPEGRQGNLETETPQQPSDLDEVNSEVPTVIRTTPSQESNTNES